MIAAYESMPLKTAAIIGSCAVTHINVEYSCNSDEDQYNPQCYLLGSCDGVGRCKYDDSEIANRTCDYIPGNDFCSVQKCRDGTCAQVSPLPDGTNCTQALDLYRPGYGIGPLAEHNGCATASCKNGKCTLTFLLDGTPCHVTGLNTASNPDCVNGKCSEGICQTDSYKPADTPCGGPCPYGCCAFCDGQGTCIFDQAGDCAINGYGGQCDYTTCIVDEFGK
eukprot:SM000099S25197  [mRNA]  locus=s99:35486:37174:- [translate_table: standard]